MARRLKRVHRESGVDDKDGNNPTAAEILLNTSWVRLERRLHAYTPFRVVDGSIYEISYDDDLVTKSKDAAAMESN